MSYITRDQLAECEAAYSDSYSRTTTAATHFFDWTFRLIETLKAYQAEHGELAKFSVNLEPEPERKIWWPNENEHRCWAWPDGSIVAIQRGFEPKCMAWGPDWLSINNGKLFNNRIEAAQALFNLKCGPYHPEPKQ